MTQQLARVLEEGIARHPQDWHMLQKVYRRQIWSRGRVQPVGDAEFIGEPARIMGGPAALAEQTGAALMPMTLWYEGKNWGAHSPAG